MEILNGFLNVLNGLTLLLSFNYVLLVLGIMALAIVWGKPKYGWILAACALSYGIFDANRSGVMELVNGSSVGMLAALSIVLTMSVLVIMALVDERN